MTTSLQSLQAQLLQLRQSLESGRLSQAQYDQSRLALERQMVDAVMARSAATPSLWLIGGLVLAVLLLATAGYGWKRSPEPPPESAASAGAEAPSAEKIAAMVEKLAQRMKEQPSDPDGWAMLARSYSVLGRHSEALTAYEKALALRPDDANLLADYADSMAVGNNRSLAGQPMKLVESALKLDPKNLKALSLAGTHAFDTKDYAGAVKYWESVVRFGPADDAFAQQFAPAIAEARSLAGMPPPAAGAGNQAAASVKPEAAAVAGRVVLSPSLASQARPDDTVFVFARPAPGTGMPLAILRKQVKDLPLDFVLDDSLAMSPATALSSARSVVVSARVSRSGNAMPQPGDLSGQTPAVAVGTRGLHIEIRDVIKP
jgi:cytochrome c-type biogenesis protein CcmH